MEIKIHCAISFAIHVLFVLYSDFHDRYFEVKYTDIDYHVCSDAAQFVYDRKSPFMRHTYRYTPLLAFLLTLNISIHPAAGKLIFSLFDVLTGLIIFKILRNYGHNLKSSKTSALLWLYNPLCIVISTRGSSESIMTFLIMITIFFFQKNRPFLFGFFYGFAVHFKIYPIMYFLTFYIILTKFPRSNLSKYNTVILSMQLNQSKVDFLSAFIVGFLFPTIYCYNLYSDDYINEAFLYHLIRKDVRHNFSPYFYLLYLSDALDPAIGTLISLFAFLVQAILITSVSFIFYKPQMLPSCLFIQTFIFVVFNKVCTSQYFLWYLCLFPLNVPALNSSITSLIKGMLLWFFGQLLWLLPAYYLEFQGMNTFLSIWIASLVMFCINIYLITKFIKFCSTASVLKEN